MKDLVTKRYTYQFKNDIGYVARSCHSAKEALNVLGERDDVKVVVKTTYAYKTGRFCTVLKQEEILLEKLTELEQTSYKLISRGKQVGDEEILSFTNALQKAREKGDVEGLLEVTSRFDRQGKFHEVKTTYLLQGVVFPASELLQRTEKLKSTAIFVQNFSSQLEKKSTMCVMTPSGIVGFVGKRVRVLDAGYALNK